MSETTAKTTSEPNPEGPPMPVFWTVRKFNAAVLVVVASLAVGALLGGWARPFDGFSFGEPQPAETIHIEATLPDATDMPYAAGPYGEGERYCPEPGSADELKVPKTDELLKIDGITDEDFLVMSDHPVVHIISSAVPAGLIRLCGGPGTLVMSGVHFDMNVHFGDYRSRIVVVDPVRADTEYLDPAKVSVAQNISVETIGCTTKGAADLRPCSSLNLQ